MAGRNGTVTGVRLPDELILLTKCYQNARRIPTWNGAVKELLETHPAILDIVARSQYDNSDHRGPERVPV